MERFFLPPNCRVWSEHGRHVFFDPANFKWVKVNDTGSLLLELLRDYMTIEEMAEYVSSGFDIPQDEARAIVRSFVTDLTQAGFLHRNEYTETPGFKFGKSDFPADIYLHLTNKCNLKCPYCYNKTDRTTKIKLEKMGLVSPTMSTQEIKDLIDRLLLYGAGRILFTGGEPLLRDDVLEVVSYARAQRDAMAGRADPVILEMLTNGIRITDDIAEFMCANLDRVTISLDGHESHLHEQERGAQTFAPTVAGIRRLVAMKKKLGCGEPMLSIVPALTDKNIGFMKEIYQFCLDDLGADNLSPILFQAGDHQELSISRIPVLRDYLDAHERTDRYLAERRSERQETMGSHPLAPRNHCGVGNGEISIDPGGFVYPCQTLHFNEFVCGNVRDTDIKDIFDNSDVMKQVRGTTADTLAVCSHCDVKHICHGGCRATAYNVYREFDRHNEIYCKTLETMAVRTLMKSEYQTPGEALQARQRV